MEGHLKSIPLTAVIGKATTGARGQYPTLPFSPVSSPHMPVPGPPATCPYPRVPLLPASPCLHLPFAPPLPASPTPTPNAACPPSLALCAHTYHHSMPLHRISPCILPHISRLLCAYAQPPLPISLCLPHSHPMPIPPPLSFAAHLLQFWGTQKQRGPKLAPSQPGQ